MLDSDVRKECPTGSSGNGDRRMVRKRTGFGDSSLQIFRRFEAGESRASCTEGMRLGADDSYHACESKER